MVNYQRTRNGGIYEICHTGVLNHRATGCTTSDFATTLTRIGAILWKIHLFVNFVLTLLCLLDIHVHCYFMKMPENVAGRIGEVVVMNCASNDTTHPCGNLVWVRHNPKTSEQIYFSRQDQLSDLVSKYIAFIDSTNGNCNLNITMRASAEGTYECIEAATTKSVTAQLIILEDDPECLVRTNGKVFNITCSVRFLGNWSPTMRWFQVNGTKSLPFDTSESTISGQIVRSTALLIGGNAPDEKGRKALGMQCSVTFTEDRKPDKTSATNVPDYEWTSPIFGGGGGNEEQSDDKPTSNDRPETNNVPYGYIAGIVILAVIAIVAIAFALLKWKNSKNNRRPTKDDAIEMKDENRCTALQNLYEETIEMTRSREELETMQS